MGKFAYIYCVVTGRVRYWNLYNNSYRDTLLARANEYEPEVARILEGLTLGSSLVVDQLLAPHEDYRMLAIDIKTISGEQFVLLHQTIIWSLSGSFFKINGASTINCLRLLTDFLGESEDGSKLASSIMYNKDINMYSNANQLLEIIYKILNFSPNGAYQITNCTRLAVALTAAIRIVADSVKQSTPR